MTESVSKIVSDYLQETQIVTQNAADLIRILEEKLTAAEARCRQLEADMAAWKNDDDRAALKELGELLKTGGMCDGYFLLGCVRAIVEESSRLRATLADLAERHSWQPHLGRCICAEHQAARALLKAT